MSDNSVNRSVSNIIVPKNNHEIFKLRERLKEEKESKRALNQTSSMNRLVNTTSRPERNKQKGLYITENSNLKLSKKSDIQEEVPVELENRKNLTNKIQNLGFKGEESVREYINKTREIILMKYSIEIKKERAVRLKETYLNKIESFQDLIAAIQDSKKMFLGEFFDKFEKYVKHLELQQEKEKNDLNILLDDKMKIDSYIKKLENEIQKQKDKMIILKSYLDFMNCVKNKSLILANDKNSKVKVKSIVSNIPKGPIYNNEQELIDDMRGLEDENIKLLDEYNEKIRIIHENKRELNKIQEDYHRIKQEDNSEMIIKEKDLYNQKIKNEKLKEEIQRLQKETEGGKYDMKNKKLNKISELKLRSNQRYNLSSNIKNVYESASDFKIKFEKDEDLNDLDRLEYIEKCINILQKYKKECLLNEDKKKELEEIEDKLENERKSKKAQEQKLKDYEKRERLKKDIFERNNKIYKLPRRIIPERMKPIEIQSVQKTIHTTNEEEVFEDLITYEIDG